MYKNSSYHIILIWKKKINYRPCRFENSTSLPGIFSEYEDTGDGDDDESHQAAAHPCRDTN